MLLKIISDIQQFADLELAWGKLTKQPLRSFEWHFSWWKHLGADRELKIYCFEVEGEIVGIAPFFVDSWIGQAKLRFIGSGTTCTDYAEIIVKPEYQAAFIDSIAQDLKQNTSIAILEMEGVSAASHSEMDDELSNYPARRYENSEDQTWVLSIPETWEKFIASSKKSLRRKAKKAKKRLDKGEIVVRSTLEDIDLDEAFSILVRLHQERFEGKGMAGAFADKNFEKFLYDAVASLAKTNRSEILVGFHDSTPIAAHLYLLDDECDQLYQAGIASAFMKLEPGHVMLTYGVRRAIEKQNKYFDFLRGDEPYKPYWGAVPHKLKTIQWVSKAFVPTAVNQTYRAVKKIKQVCESFQLLSSTANAH